jgi:hypothetical protein
VRRVELESRSRRERSLDSSRLQSFVRLPAASEIPDELVRQV